MWKVICFGGFLAAQAVVPLMLKQSSSAPRQSLLFTGASGSLARQGRVLAFAAGKGALRMMVQSLAREFNAQGIHVGHVIIDGAINGDKVRSRYAEYLDSKGEDGALEIDAIASAFFMLHEQHRSAWTQELDLRPFKEEF